MIILHFAQKNEWDDALKDGSYGMPLIIKNGFIPCHTFSSLTTNNFSFSTLNNYIVLCIDEDKVKSQIKYEKQTNSDLMEPNIYGTLNTDAVISISPYIFDNNDNFVATPELLDFIFINKVCEKLKIKYVTHKNFNDGTSSRIILLNNQYLLKKANPNILKAEVTFANFYFEVPSLQKVIFAEENYEYVVYEFIPGDVMHTVSNFEDLTLGIKKIVSNYRNYFEDGYGHISSPVNTWNEFLKSEVNECISYFPDMAKYLPSVNEAIDELDKYPFTKKLIHGDFGTSNFIKVDEKFVAAIDAKPIAGDPTYDLLFALVSNVDLLQHLLIEYLMEYTGESKNKITALLKIVLFCRVCKCEKYNKEFLDTYLDFWCGLFD